MGSTLQFTALGTYSDGTSHDITPQVTWTSSNPAAATISSSGLATAISAGNATITATLGSISGNTTLTVTAAILSSITVKPANPSIPVEVTLQFTALGTYSDGSTRDITTQVTWTSSNPGAATISRSGLATALAAGTVNITATFETISGSTTLTVTSATLSSIAVVPSRPAGATQQFVAIGTNSDGSTQDITQQVTWTSSNTSLTTVNSSGQATAIAAGDAGLIATTQSNFFPYLSVNISGATTLRVTP